MPHSETKSSSSTRFLIDMQADHLLIFGKALEAPKARDVVEQILFGAARMASDPGFQQDASWFRVRWLAEIRLGLFRRKQRHAALPARLRCVVAFSEQSGKGIYPRDANPGELASYVMTVLQGMAVQGANGARRNQLRRIAQIALRAWPKR